MEFNEQMSEITVPMFIAHGDDDKVCHIEGSTKLEKTVSSKDKIFMVSSVNSLHIFGLHIWIC